jgi:hypothetical protein
MTSHGYWIPIVQAVLCFGIVMLFRITLVYFGFRLGGILMGTPMVVFPLLAMQAWLGPPVTQDQTIGSVASMTAIALGLWSLWVPVNLSPILAILTMASAWLSILLVLYASRMPVAAMAAAIVANSAYILTRYRNHRPAAGPNAARIGEAAIPTAIFLLAFFLLTHLVPDFVRGVFAMLPVTLLATIYFVRRATSAEGFRSFLTYTHAAIVATAAFVIAVHFTISQMPPALSLGLSLVISVAASVTVNRIWRPPIGAAPSGR